MQLCIEFAKAGTEFPELVLLVAVLTCNMLFFMLLQFVLLHMAFMVNSDHNTRILFKFMILKKIVIIQLLAATIFLRSYFNSL